MKAMCIQALPSTLFSCQEQNNLGHVYSSRSIHIVYVYSSPCVHIHHVYLSSTLINTCGNRNGPRRAAFTDAPIPLSLPSTKTDLYSLLPSEPSSLGFRSMPPLQAYTHTIHLPRKLGLAPQTPAIWQHFVIALFSLFVGNSFQR